MTDSKAFEALRKDIQILVSRAITHGFNDATSPKSVIDRDCHVIANEFLDEIMQAITDFIEEKKR